MKSTEQQNKQIEQDFLKDVDNGIITDGYCDGEQAQADFDENQKGKPPLDL